MFSLGKQQSYAGTARGHRETKDYWHPFAWNDWLQGQGCWIENFYKGWLLMIQVQLLFL